jgi:hypothetical protein
MGFKLQHTEQREEEEMATLWLRLWHDMPNDPKWRTIARISSQPIPNVIAVYVHLLVEASANATERGRTQPNAEDLGSALDIDCEGIRKILEAMEGRVIDHGLLTGWKVRQPEREDGSAERARAWRERQKQLGNDPDEPNAGERNRTPKNADKEEKKKKNSSADFALPEWVPSEPWAAWIEVRKEKKAPNTERALKMAVNELAKLRADGHSPAAVLNQSTINGWRGIFPLHKGPDSMPTATPTKAKSGYAEAAERQRAAREQARKAAGLIN